ncbi:glycerophosphoryl diester phosphodiesterase [Vibrio vulnificus]|jgi:glycerophosphoryl diester phosphodiesterase|uniref:Glycerophosphoryl diester phosphodiesterase n=1 Tax=Vibrio vulnificus TaxID=672 RepID=A0ABX4WWQ5_VIBVL|nr:glycerophosphoryl diester phosphodiesterase [Vibrio vulnificus]AUL95430.1 Glycerophosphoryl diester phosphodiesterase [Vibrio vulnificus]EGQ7851767.1 glycerophosphoryl diester phosphodiesterase [Vibrio vulnificus]EGQ7932468.1 glycerophosphoryl diester phosphodiesterase [Vibrio vulnificus]EGQ7965726.1 glycerophosphoryl diester phosphodiesterase [Vibrio vulnificus]EGQ7991336.1 glycerophosphoryl diester phosphodiesterase [Vibrio vulnificus]
MPPMIVGHRGVAGSYPENTRVSVQAAIDLGLSWVEIDVQPTKDNVLVVCHDHTIDRCSNGKGRVDAYSLKELQAFDFGGWFDEAFAGEQIMTLESLLNLAAEYDLGLNIEVKVDNHDVGKVALNLKNLLDKSPLTADKILLSSFSHDIILQLHQHCPGYKLGVLSERLSQRDRQVLKEVNAFSCNLNYRWITEKHIRDLKTGGYQIWCYTVNQADKFRYLDKVDAIFSDYPERFI